MHQLTKQLKRWQAREFAHRLAWGFARWSAIVIGTLAVCCLADWLIDRSVDTPFTLRVLMTLTQVALAVALGYLLLFKLNVPHIDVLAGQAEEAIPEFDHRLVTALQLNRPDAQTQGMSPQLIDAVTLEAESLSARHNLASLVDGTRIERAALVFIPVVLAACTFLVLRPTLSTALLKRQCLLDVPIPRSVSIENITPTLQAAGDAVWLRFAVRGDFREESVGQVVIEPDNLPRENYPLKFDSKLDEETAIFACEVPPSSTPFSFKAWLQDGRTHSTSRIEFAARPVVTEVNAWLILPSYVDPEKKKRFERYQPQGEVTTLPDCGLHVEVMLSKPVKNATLILFSRADGKNETEISRTPMTHEGTQAACILDQIPPAAVAYRIQVVDENNFENVNPPRRGIGSGIYKAPTVKLLAEVLKDPNPEIHNGPLEDYAVDGMPLAVSGQQQVQIAYHARSPLGISKVFIWYRVNPTDREKDAWSMLPLAPTEADLAKMGPFVPELGAFLNSGVEGSVEFYSFPSPDPEREPAGIEAGGRINFQTKSLQKTLPNGDKAKLEVGDQVEFLVAAFDRNPDPNRPAGESQSRIKAVVSYDQLLDWNRQLSQSQGRLQELFAKQRRVFQSEKDRKAQPKP